MEWEEDTGPRIPRILEAVKVAISWYKLFRKYRTRRSSACYAISMARLSIKD